MWLYGWKLVIVSHHLAKFGGHRLCGSRVISLFHVTLLDHIIKGSKGMWFYGRKLLIVYSHPTKFSGYIHRGSWHMTYVFNLSCDLAKPRNYIVMWLYGWKSLKVSHHSAKFCAQRDCGSGDMVLIDHLISQDHVIKGSCDFMGETPHGKSHLCQV